MWDILKKTERYSFVPENKVMHIPIGKAKVKKKLTVEPILFTEHIFFLNQAILALNVSFENDIWVFENTEWKMAIEDVRNHIKSSGEFGPDDIIIFADIDEMLSRKVLNSLKHCELRHGVLSGAIIMPMGNLDLAFRL